MQRNEVILKANLDKEVRRIRFTPNSFEDLNQQIAKLFSLEQGSFTIKYIDDEGDLVSLSSDEELKESINCSQKNILRITVFRNHGHVWAGGHHGHGHHRWGGWKGFHGWNKWREGNEEEEEIPRGGHCKRWGGWNNGFKGCGQQQHQQPSPNQPQFQHTQGVRRGPPFCGLIGQVLSCLREGKIDPIVENFVNAGVVEIKHNHICDGCETQIKGTRYHCTECPDFDFCQNCFEGDKKATHPSHKFEEITALQAFRSAFSRGQEEEENNTTPVKQPVIEEPTINEPSSQQETVTLSPTPTPLPEPKTETPPLLKLKSPQLPLKEEEKEEKVIPMTPTPVKEEKSTTFGQMLQDLSVMGFDDRKRNIKLLLKYKGDIQQVVAELLLN